MILRWSIPAVLAVVALSACGLSDSTNSAETQPTTPVTNTEASTGPTQTDPPTTGASDTMSASGTSQSKAGSKQSNPPTDGQSDPPSPNSEPIPLDDRSVITQEDSGKHFVVSMKNRVNLHLSNDYLWTGPTVQGDAVELITVNYFTDPGFMDWELFFTTTGEVTVAAEGEPSCAQGNNCPNQGISFLVTITVTD